MSSMNDKHKEAYREEAYEMLAELEDALLELEDLPEDRELIGRVFRAMHTIKGSGAMFGFDDIARFTHEMETVFDLVRGGAIPVTEELIDLTLRARDHIRLMLDASATGEPVDMRKGDTIIRELKKMLPLKGTEDAGMTEEEKKEKLASGDDVSYRIVFKPRREIFEKGTNPLFLLEDLRRLGDCMIIAQIDEMPLLDEINPEYCYTYWDVILTTSKGINAIKDVFIFVEDDAEIRVDVIDEGGEISDETDYLKLGEILVERGDITRDDLQQVLGGKKLLGEALVASGLVGEGQVESALLEQKRIQAVRKERHARETASTIRVSSEKLDTLVDLVGELVTVRAHLTQMSANRSDPELLGISEAVERLTAELHDNAMSIRMVPIGSTFSNFRRLVRDLSRELSREVKLSTGGAETELDKTVIERLNDPMVHIIRNCIDHGIEWPEERKAMGKPSYGTVHLSAMHSGADVLIRIQDDGKGIDPGVIRSKAIDKGLIPPDAELSEKEILDLVFMPGFSTAQAVTGVSGRGVGMDVVKRSIEALRGSVEINSVKGRGTTLTLRIPLTLAIIEGLLVKIREEFFVLPLSSVVECVELSREDIKKAHGRHIVHVRGEVVPYIRLRERFDMNGDLPVLEQVVVVKDDGRRVGFAVDSVIGEHQTVIKTLGKLYRQIKGISGATILGDGTVALILDVSKLIESAELDEQAAVERGP